MVKKQGYWLLAIFVVAFLLRTGMLKNSLWLDEAFSVRQASMTQSDIWQDRIDPAHPPLYYAILHEWMNLFGVGETAVRLPSLLISLVNMGLLYLLARLMFDKDVALVAVSLLALSPLDIWYAAEARMYVLVAFAGLLAAVGLVWQNWLGLLLYGVALAAGLYLDYTFLPLWAGITAVWLVYWWQQGHHLGRLAGWLVMTLLAWWAYQPWYPYLFALLARLNNITLFIRLRQTAGFPGLEPLQYLILLLLGAFGAAVGAYVLWQLLRREKLRRILTPIFLVGFILVTLMIPFPRAYSLKKIVVTGWPFIILLVAWLVAQWSSQARPRAVWYGLLAVSLFSSITTILFVPKDDWRGMVTYIETQAAGEDLVLIDPGYNDIPYNYYQPRLLPRSVPVDELEETAVADVWLVVERFPGSLYPYTLSQQWLDENRELVEIIPFYRLELRHYTP